MKVVHDWYWARGQAGPYCVIASYITSERRPGLTSPPARPCPVGRTPISPSLDPSWAPASRAACGDSLAALEGGPPLGMFAFDCIGRRGVLGDEGIQAEVDRLVAHGAGAPVAGFYTYGEIARTRGMRGFHNQTLVVLSIS